VGNPIGAFIPQREIGGMFQLQGLVLFVLYLAGIAGAVLVAWLLKCFTAAGRQVRPLMMELPSYHLPTVRNVAIGLWQRAKIFIRRVGGIILISAMLIWFLSSYPVAPKEAGQSAIEYSFAGQMGKAMALVFEPIGFNWQLSVALIPAMAAREAVVSSLGTVYSLSSDDEEETEKALSEHISGSWSLATTLSLLAWFVFAPHCLATLAAVKWESGGWTTPLIMSGYLFGLAYLAAFITYRVALGFGLG
jgi:ferrous iron transport protein B